MNQRNDQNRPWRGDASRLVLSLCALGGMAAGRVGAEEDAADRLRAALSFHASFDHGPDADHARGDRALYHAATLDQRHEATAGLPASGEVKVAEGAGKFGHALQFGKTRAPAMLFKADRNFPGPRPDWSGTVSVWLNLDPAKDLDPGFCDPIQLTSKQWDDAAMFLEFEKRAEGVPFRLGVYADKAVWNPQGRKWEEIPAAEKPLLTVNKTPFARGTWTHVAFVIEHFNTGLANGTARLYIDGKEAGLITARPQTFTWDSARAVILLGVSYAGLMDDLALFDRALDAGEISRLFTLQEGVRELHPTP